VDAAAFALVEAGQIVLGEDHPAEQLQGEARAALHRATAGWLG
jgi:hypothetical protein